MRMRRTGAAALAEATRDDFVAAVGCSALDLDPEQRAAARAMADHRSGGVYLWGSAGRGKTALSSLYFDAIPTSAKRRFHFHEFFAAIDAFITSTRGSIDDALDELVGGVVAIMFDEFHVHDIADAIYLTAMLRRLVGNGTLLIATSN